MPEEVNTILDKELGGMVDEYTGAKPPNTPDSEFKSLFDDLGKKIKSVIKESAITKKQINVWLDKKCGYTASLGYKTLRYRGVRVVRIETPAAKAGNLEVRRRLIKQREEAADRARKGEEERRLEGYLIKASSLLEKAFPKDVIYTAVPGKARTFEISMPSHSELNGIKVTFPKMGNGTEKKLTYVFEKHGQKVPVKVKRPENGKAAGALYAKYLDLNSKAYPDESLLEAI